MLSKIAGIARSSFYYGLKGSAIERRDAAIIEKIKSLSPYEQKRGSKPKSKNLCITLEKPINHKRIARICKKNDMLSRIRQKKVPKGYYAALEKQQEELNGNILGRHFEAKRPMQRLVTDISYFRVKEGWLYLSPIMDLYNGEIVAYKCSKRCDTNLSMETLKLLRGRNHFLNAILHSDLGSTYTSKKFLDEANFQGFVKSFSRKGNCWDNASIESFFGTIKHEIEYFDMLKTKLMSYDVLEKIIEEYVLYFNENRIQKKLGWLSPVQYRRKAA